MPRNIMFLDCLLESLDGRYSEDLIRWHDYDERIFEISFRHGNSKKGGKSQFEAAQVWLAWDQKKNRLPDFLKMECKAINQHLTEVRQRYRQALKSQVVAGILKRLPCEKFKELFQILPPQERKPSKRSRTPRRRQSSYSSSEPDSPSSSGVTSPSAMSTDDEQKAHCAPNTQNFNHVVIYVTYIGVPPPTAQSGEIPDIVKEEELSNCEIEDSACVMVPQNTETFDQDFQDVSTPGNEDCLLNSSPSCEDIQLLQDIILEDELPDLFGEVPLLDLTTFNLGDSLDDIHTDLYEADAMLQA